jgi:endonuclease G
MKAKQQKNECGCHAELDMEASIENLSAQVRHLSQTLVNYMGQADLDDRSERNRLAIRASKNLARIIGGHVVDDGTFLECCLIGKITGGGFLQEFFCTGTLIHPKVIITAKHCITNISIGDLDPNVVALPVDRESQVTKDSLTRLSRIIEHPTEDVALLILRRPSKVEPVTCATATEISSAERVELVGYGNSNPNGTMGFGIKRQVNVPMNVVREGDEDLTDAEWSLGFNSYTEFVAGRKGTGKDSCNGDSGGPAYIMVDGKRKLAGATSRATDEAMNNCGDGGVYVRIDELSEWIDDTVNTFCGGW